MKMGFSRLMFIHCPTPFLYAYLITLMETLSFYSLYYKNATKIGLQKV